MKDLYRLLGVPRQADAATIAGRVAALAPGHPTRVAAEQILLQPGRRVQYDLAFDALSRIGRIRGNLGLLGSPFWVEGNFRDFDGPRDSNPVSQLDGLKASLTQAASQRPAATGKRSGYVKYGWYALAFIGLMLVLQQVERADPAVTPDTAGWGEFERAASAPAPVVPALPLPATGIIEHAFAGLPEGAPFEVVTAPGGGHYIKLVSLDSGRAVVTGFVRGGEAISTLLPPGQYELRYASGDYWYGPDALFGPGTRYAKADEAFNLRETPGGYEGVTVQLILQRSGNLETTGIPANAF